MRELTAILPERLHVHVHAFLSCLSRAQAVPPTGEILGVQVSYHVVVTERTTGKVQWDSGKVVSNKSINVELDGSGGRLKPGTAYAWTVACNGGPASEPAPFVTSLWDGFDPNAKWIWAGDLAGSQHFALFRHVVTEPSLKGRGIKGALLFVTAQVEPTMLAAYKVYIDGVLVSLGPGRGEANILRANNTFMHAPYTTVDVTGLVQAGTVLAIEGMAPLYDAPCNLHVCRDPNTHGGAVLAQLVLSFADGTTTTISTGQDWSAVAADKYYNPTAPGITSSGLQGETAYAKIMENIDARVEVKGDWKVATAMVPAWDDAVPAQTLFMPQANSNLIARMARPMQVFDVPQQALHPVASHGATAASPTTFFVDFGRMFQGGVILGTTDGVAGTTMRIISGEQLMPNGTIDSTTGTRISGRNTWGYTFNWTLRDGGQSPTHDNTAPLFQNDVKIWI